MSFSEFIDLLVFLFIVGFVQFVVFIGGHYLARFDRDSASKKKGEREF